MRIYCPECNSGYEIDAALIPQKGRKLRCSACKNTFLCYPDDLQPEVIRTRNWNAEDEQKAQEENKKPAVAQEKTAEEKPAAEAIAAKILEEVQEPVEPETTAPAAEMETPAPEKPETTAPVESDPVPVASNEMQDIFKRLSEQTQTLHQAEQSLSPRDKIKMFVKSLFSYQHRVARRYFYGTVLLLLSLLMFYYRFEIVRKVPSLNNVYKAVGIKAYVTGEGLEFQNVSRNEYEDDYIRKLEVKGFIANLTDADIDVPVIHVEMLDKNTNLLQTVEEKAPVEKIHSGARIAFSVTVNKPSPLTKYIFLTFVDKVSEAN